MMKKIIIILFLFILTSNCSKLSFFGFGKEKNEFDKLKINEYLWIASNELLQNYTNTESNLKDKITCSKNKFIQVFQKIY